MWNPESKTVLDSLTLADTLYRFSLYRYMLFQFQCIQGCMCSYKIPQCYYRKHWHHTVWSFVIHSLISGRRKNALIFAGKVIFEGLYYSRTSTNTTAAYPQWSPLYSCHPLGGQSIHWLLFKPLYNGHPSETAPTFFYPQNGQCGEVLFDFIFLFEAAQLK